MENRKPLVPFSGWLREELKVRHMSQMNLSLETGIDQPHICTYTTGKVIPTLKSISLILDAFGMQLAVVSKNED